MSTRARDTRVVSVPGWWSTVTDAEAHGLEALAGLEVLSACTHVADGIALVTAEVPEGPAARRPAAAGGTVRWAHLAQQAVADHEAHYGGRLFVFPGQERLHGATTAAELLGTCGIDELVVPGHPGPVPGSARVEGLDRVRPVYRQGLVVLTLRPTGPGVLRPFEGRRPGIVTRPAH